MDELGKNEERLNSYETNRLLSFLKTLEHSQMRQALDKGLCNALDFREQKI
jgi:hypothetical protein